MNETKSDIGKIKEKKWSRKCPKCEKKIFYKSQKNRNFAEIRNYKCLSCTFSGRHLSENAKLNMSKSKTGEGNPFFGKQLSSEHRRKISESIKRVKPAGFGGRKHSEESKEKIRVNSWHLHTEETKRKIGNATIGNKANSGKKLSKETKKKMRLSAIKRIEKNKGQIKPNYNPRAIPILESNAEKLNITDLQHAENGGEFYIKDLGYWADGYSKSTNTWFEYYEKRHRFQIEKDKKRKQEIINYLKCEFIEIWGK